MRVADKHQFFEDREAYFNQVFADHPQTPKLLVDVAEFDWDRLWLEWATGAETLLITASRSEIPTSTLHFLLAGEDLTESELGDSSLILNHYLDLDRDPVKELPRDYFPIEEIPYKKISLKKQ